MMRTHRQVQDGVATVVVAEAPASRKECFGVFCNIYDLEAVSPSASHGPSAWLLLLPLVCSSFATGYDTG